MLKGTTIAHLYLYVQLKYETGHRYGGGSDLKWNHVCEKRNGLASWLREGSRNEHKMLILWPKVCRAGSCLVAVKARDLGLVASPIIGHTSTYLQLSCYAEFNRMVQAIARNGREITAIPTARSM